VSGRSGVATQAMSQLNAVGFAVTEDQLQAPQGQEQTGVTVEYASSQLGAALTVAAAVPGATLVPNEALGSQVRLLLGESYTGTVTAVRSGASVTGTLSDQTAGSVADSVGTLTSGELASINAGAALCA